MEGDLRAAAGFHGYGPQVFLGWIAAQTDREWALHPDPNGWSGTGNRDRDMACRQGSRMADHGGGRSHAEHRRTTWVSSCRV